MDGDTQTYKQLCDFPKLVIILGDRCLMQIIYIGKKTQRYVFVSY